MCFFNPFHSIGAEGRGAYSIFVLGYHWLPLATINLAGDNKKIEV